MQIKEKIPKYSNFKTFFPPSVQTYARFMDVLLNRLADLDAKKQADLHRQACRIETSRY
jgi:hypothetical protein